MTARLNRKCLASSRRWLPSIDGIDSPKSGSAILYQNEQSSLVSIRFLYTFLSDFNQHFLSARSTFVLQTIRDQSIVCLLLATAKQTTDEMLIKN